MSQCPHHETKASEASMAVCVLYKHVPILLLTHHVASTRWWTKDRYLLPSKGAYHNPGNITNSLKKGLRS